MSLLGSLKGTASGMMNVGKGLAQALTSQFASVGKLSTPNIPNQENIDLPAQIMGMIYKLMVISRTEEVLHRELDKNRLKSKEKEEEQRNKELIKALSVRRKKTKAEPKKDEQKQAANQQKKDINEAETAAKKAPKATAAPKAPAPTTTRLPIPATTIAGAVAAGGLMTMASSVIAKEEGLPKKGKAYWDPPGQNKLVSIGYGHQIKEDEYKQGFIQIGDEKVPLVGNRGIDTTLTPKQAKSLLEIDIPKYENAAKKPLGDSWNKLNDVQKSALISYSYNTGSTQSLVKAGLKDAIDSGDMQRAGMIIKEKGTKTAGGVFNQVLADRRTKESALFLSKEPPAVTTTPPVIPPSSGVQIDNSSKQNKDMKSAAQLKSQINVNNTNIAAAQAQNKQITQDEDMVDDRPAVFRK